MYLKQNSINVESIPAEKKREPQQIHPKTKPGFETFENFMCLQHMAMMFANSTIVPKSYQNNVANCAIAINIAAKINEDPLTVFSNLYIISSISSWKRLFLMTLLNRSKKYTTFQFIMEGDKDTDSWGYRLQAFDKGLKKPIEGPAVTIAMAKKEGWYNKQGSKWLTMPELMLTYQCITFFVYTVAPEITCGVNYIETEAEDITGNTIAEVQLENIIIDVA